MNAGIAVVVADRAGAGRCTVQRVRELSGMPSVMVVALGTPPRLHVPAGPLSTSQGWPRPTPQPGDPAQDAVTIVYAIDDARRAAPGAPVELLLFTDPALDGPRLVGLDPSIRVRHDLAPGPGTHASVRPGDETGRKRTPVGLFVAGALVLGLAFGGVGMWLAGRDQNPTAQPSTITTTDAAVATTKPATQPPDPGTTPTPSEPPATTAPPTTSGLVAPTGRWSGPVTGDRASYDMEVSFTEIGSLLGATVAYPHFACSGEWIETSRDATTITLTETITVGTDRCVRTGTVTLTPSGDTVHFAYSSPGRRSLASTLRPA